MKRIGITQRVEVIGAYQERRDCLDQRWAGLLSSLGYVVIPVPNTIDEPERWADSLGMEGLVLSGGNDLASLAGAINAAPERDRTEGALLAWAEARSVPVLGICRGLQMINIYHGGSLIRIEQHAGTRHRVQISPDCGWLPFSAPVVNSFHNWGLSEAGVGTGLVAAALAEDGTVEALQHRSLPVYGVMWHPERESSLQQHDRRMLQSIFHQH